MKKEYYVFKINLKVLNIFSLVILGIAILFSYILFPSLTNLAFGSFWGNLISLPCLIGYMMLHELFHALGYILYGVEPKKITFGAELEKGVFYCLCKQDVSRKNILNASMFPLFWLGIVTYIISIIFNLPLLFWLSIINISGAAGDIMYFMFFNKLDKDIKFSELDDGTSFAILSENDISNVKSFGLEFVGKVKEIPRSDFTRVKISKLSWIFIIICLVSLILHVFDIIF